MVEIQSQMAKQVNTEHPYVVQHKTASGVEPHVRGTNIAVRHVVGQYRHYGTIEGVLNAYPHLSAAQVHDALSYYYDHVEEIESHSQANAEETWQSKDPPGVFRRKTKS